MCSSGWFLVNMVGGGCCTLSFTVMLTDVSTVLCDPDQLNTVCLQDGSTGLCPCQYCYSESETHTGQPEYIHWEMVGPHNDYTAAVCGVSD